MLKKLINLLDMSHHQLRVRVNTLENENEVLKETIKDELYKEFMKKLGEPAEMKRLRTENKNYRKRIKLLKEELKNG